MRTRIIDRYAKIISAVIVLAILLASLSGLGVDDVFYEEGDKTFEYCCYSDQQTHLDEAIHPDELSNGVAQAVLLRHLSTRKNSAVSHRVSILNRYTMPIRFFVFLSYRNLSENESDRSDRFVIRYIHSKDGEK